MNQFYLSCYIVILSMRLDFSLQGYIFCTGIFVAMQYVIRGPELTCMCSDRGLSIRTKIQHTRGSDAQMLSPCEGIKTHACVCLCAELSSIGSLDKEPALFTP